MKKKEKYYSINNQEDEDGYILYAEAAIVNENAKKKSVSHAGNKIPHVRRDKSTQLVLNGEK